MIGAALLLPALLLADAEPVVATPWPVEVLSSVWPEAGERVELVTAPPDELLSVLRSGRALCWGYPIARLAPLVARGEARWWGGTGRAVPLFADPVLCVWSDGGTGIAEPPTGFAPEVRSLADGAFHDMLLLAEPRPGSATGCLFASLGLGLERGERLVIGLDANRRGPYLADEIAVLRRLAREEPGPVGLVRSSTLVRLRETGLADTLHAAPLADRTTAVLLAAAHSASGAADERLAAWAARVDEGVLASVARRVGLVALASESPEARAIAAEAERLIDEQVGEARFLERFDRDLRGRYERREAWYSEVFDTVGLLLLAAFVVYLLRRVR